MSELKHNTDTVERYEYPASSKDAGYIPNVRAEVRQDSNMIQLYIPTMTYDTTDLDMSIDCAKAIIEVLSTAITQAKANHSLMIERNKEEMK